MIDVDALAAQPWLYDFFNVLRAMERENPGKPRIGDSATRRDDVVALGENPYLEFPMSTIEGGSLDDQGRLKLLVRFLGLMGPQGALPLSTTEEAYGWLPHDDSFPRFLDLFNNRFLQLFFRAWADARPSAQSDQPDRDRFSAYIGAAIGIGSSVFRDLDAVSDHAKLTYAGLMSPQAKSSGRLEQVIAGLFGLRVEVTEFVGSWLQFEDDCRISLGGSNSTLGYDMQIGARAYSVRDKIRIRVIAPDLAAYRRLLPSGDLNKPLNDLVFFYLGFEVEWDLELALPSKAAEPMRLGRTGHLGWVSWLAPQWSQSDETLRADVRLAYTRFERQAGRARAAQEVKQ